MSVNCDCCVLCSCSFLFFFSFWYFRNSDVRIITLTNIMSDVSMCYFAKVVRSCIISQLDRESECTVLKFVNKTHVQGNRNWIVLLIV